MSEPVIYYVWQMPEREQTKRGKWWWLFTGSVSLVFFTYSLVTNNFAFAVILVMFALIMILGRQKMRGGFPVIIADSGVVIDEIHYPYENIHEFFIIEDAKKMYFNFRRVLSSRVDIALPEDIDTKELRMVLKRHLAENEDQKNIPLIDTVLDKLKMF